MLIPPSSKRGWKNCSLNKGRWLFLKLGSLPHRIRNWTSRKNGRAVLSARSSMPGPDGMPANAYKTFGDFAVDILYSVSQALGKEDPHRLLSEAYWDRCGAEPHAFNDALLCCLLKKSLRDFSRIWRSLCRRGHSPSGACQY